MPVVSSGPWTQHYKYVYNEDDLKNIPITMLDTISQENRNALIESMSEHASCNDVASNLKNYVAQAIDRSCKIRKIQGHTGNNKTWYDAECRTKRAEAVKAGAHVENIEDQENMIAACREYNACKQRKKRQFASDCAKDIELAFKRNKSGMWKVLKRINRNLSELKDMPPKDEFYSHFAELAQPKRETNFNYAYEQNAKEFLDKYDTGTLNHVNVNDIELHVLNRNFTIEEIGTVIDSLKTNKTPGIDMIPSEVIKMCKDILLQDITDVMNYVIEERHFPDKWAEGLRAAIFKSGKRNVTNN